MILISTLGLSWAVIPEVLAFLDPERFPLFACDVRGTHFKRIRAHYGLEAPDELWVVTTEGVPTEKALGDLRRWWGLMGSPYPLRVFRALNTGETGDEQECALVREVIFRVVARAASARQRPILCLAGGRKTMSADLQLAGSTFGCTVLLHVITPAPLPEEIARAEPPTFTQPLPSTASSKITPVVVGTGIRREYLDVPGESAGAVTAARFPIPLPAANAEPMAWAPEPSEPWLTVEVAERERQASRLLGNFIATVSREEHHENWRSLYRLAPSIIQRLRTERPGSEHRELLRAIPKADLHLHLGGCLPVASQQQVAKAILEATPRAERERVTDSIAPLFGPRPFRLDLKVRLGETAQERALAASLLLTNLSPEELERRLFEPTEPRRALRDRGKRGFRLYEFPGDLSGSTLLSHEAAIMAYAREALKVASEAGCRYVELRGSPDKYLGGDGTAFLRLFHQAARRAQEEIPGVEVRFVIIADRRRQTKVSRVVDLALKAREDLGPFVAGIDLAGDEKRGDPARLARHFREAFSQCIPLTIHAGEGEGAGNIWKAAYHLHADRIGHGLTLAEKPELAARIRERRICLELCPSSNLEVVGFHDPADPGSEGFPRYPLETLYQMGLLVTVATDNPGISRTTLADEYLTASRLSNSLSLWDTLTMIKHGFEYSFLAAEEKGSLMKEADARIYEILSALSPEKESAGTGGER